MVLSQDLVAVPEPAVHSDTLSGNEVFRKDEFRVMRVHSYGTNCFHQTGKNPRGRFPGPKFFMQQEAALLNHGVQVALHKWSGKRTPAGVPIGWRSFASYPDWETAQRHLRAAHHGSVNEIIQHGKPCKPYLDLDGKDGLPFRPEMGQTDVAGAETEGQQRNPEVPDGVSGESGAEVGAQPGGEGAGERYTVAEVIEIVEEWSEIVFGECYNVQLKRPSSFVWMESGGQSKFSLHLTINHLDPRQLIFGANSEGALHFATRLKKRLQPWHPRVASLIDLNVYTKDRE